MSILPVSEAILTASTSKRLKRSKSTVLSWANFADALHLDGNTAPSLRNITACEFLAVDVKINAGFAISLADTDKF